MPRTTNVEPEMYNCTSNNWSHWNSNKLKEKFGNCTRKTFERFTTKDSYTWNITHSTESTAVWSLKAEWWGSALVQEKYREEKACDKRFIIIIIHDKWVPVTTEWCVLRMRMEERPPIWRVAANILNKKLQTADIGGPPAWGLGEVLTTPHCKNASCYETPIQ